MRSIPAVSKPSFRGGALAGLARCAHGQSRRSGHKHATRGKRDHNFCSSRKPSVYDLNYDGCPYITPCQESTPAVRPNRLGAIPLALVFHLCEIQARQPQAPTSKIQPTAAVVSPISTTSRSPAPAAALGGERTSSPRPRLAAMLDHQRHPFRHPRAPRWMKRFATNDRQN